YGLDAERGAGFVLAVDEVATNSIRYGGDRGELRGWESADALVCEVRDRGHITNPLIGRVRPADEAVSGRGLWIANQECDLVQVPSAQRGSPVRPPARR